MLKEVVEKSGDVSSKVIDFKHPKELQKLINLSLEDRGVTDDTLLQCCEQIIQYSVKTGHPHFFNQLFSGLDRYGLAGSWLTEVLNTSQYTYEVAPVFTLMEQVVLGEMCKVVGFKNGDGIFCPGGSVSNICGLNVARFKKFPAVKAQGMQALPKLCIFTSEQSHYSMKKGAALIGLGLDNVRLVPCDSRGKMDTEALGKLTEQAKAEGFTPYLVNATGGTTVLGAYDPIVEIADICEKYDMWLHVDVCWGGGALLSAKHRALLDGIERADSVAWNPHKMMGAPLQCCAFLTKETGILQQAHSANASYLFQQDKFYDVSYDTGDKSLQCGRKVDVLKVWMMWKAKGHAGFEAKINNAFAMAGYLTEKLKTLDGFRLINPEPECTNVCFWFIPPSMRGEEEDAAWWQKLGKVAPNIKEQMVMKGTMMIGYQPLGDKVNFFRVVVSNEKLTTADMDFIIDEIAGCGQNL
ncbi:hypothetical protein NP493_519g05084 [Ridgeia piscesae]|uniref:Glutamate decarboxylase n=1 Tax=Ridgeia piscesae TaxID=27915 RepID=A0AAD9KX26_RIDPI|nr:hypothetical protein NP493_519g05084 [Ridgeia piscesae]